jgi:hypothetical protein
MTTTFIQQGMTMDARVHGFKIPVASLVSVVFMLLWVVLHEAAVIPLAPSEARAAALMARRNAGSTDGSIVEVACSMRDAMEDSAAIDEEDEPEKEESCGLVGLRWISAEFRRLV